jgi:hypothetical protein
VHAEIIDLGGTDIFRANADMHRNTGDEGYQLLVGRDANTNMPFPLPLRRHKSLLQELGSASEPECSLLIFDVISRQKLIHLFELKQE